MENDLLNGFEVFSSFRNPGEHSKTFDTDTTTVEEDLLQEHVELVDDETPDDQQEPTEPTEDDKTSTEQTETEPEDSTPYESFFDVLNEGLGITLDGEFEKPKTPEDLVEYFKEVIAENSKPQYASDDLYELDQFVRNGGDIKEYFNTSSFDYDNLDITDDEEAQTKVLESLLKEQGYNAQQIARKIEKYNDAGLLEDEALDALEQLKTINAEQKQQLLAEQENAAQMREQQQQQYLENVITELKGMDTIRGIKIPEQDKAVLWDYIFKTDKTGQSQFNRDWAGNVKNLLETAYFTMKGDTLLSAARTQGSNKAVEKFKSSLDRQGVSRRSRSTDNTANDMWSAFAKKLRN